MKIITFYADCKLPPKPASKCVNFDWRLAIKHMSASAKQSLDADTLVVTDINTDIPHCARVGDAMEDGVMVWLLDAQVEAIRISEDRILMVSPDTLITGKLDMLFSDDWDVCLLTRERPTPIINSIIAVNANDHVEALWSKIANDALSLSEAELSWGADISAVVNAIKIKPNEDAIREIDGVRIRLMPMYNIFKSVDLVGEVKKYPQPIWDFKGMRKSRMVEYAKSIGIK